MHCLVLVGSQDRGKGIQFTRFICYTGTIKAIAQNQERAHRMILLVVETLGQNCNSIISRNLFPGQKIIIGLVWKLIV